MATYPTKLAEAFSARVLQKYFQSSVTEAITNKDYEGEVRDKASMVNIMSLGLLGLKNYTGSNMGSPDDLTEVVGQLKTDQAKAFYFAVKSWDKFRSFVKNPEKTVLAQCAEELKQVMDNFILGLYTDVAAGNRIGTDYVTGTVTVTTGTGAVTGSGTTFTAAMVGKPFRAAGHTKWYRVKSYASTTSIVIENDSDDETSAYDGGAIGSGASYVIQAATSVQITKSNVYQYITDLSTMLDNGEIPEGNRWLVVPPYVAGLIRQAPEYVAIGSESGRDEAVKRGFVGEFAGFRVYKASEQRIHGNGTDGWHIMGGHVSAITRALGMTETGTEDLHQNFGKAYKSLFVYGAKVLDERRKALVELYGKK